MAAGGTREEENKPNRPIRHIPEHKYREHKKTIPENNHAPNKIINIFKTDPHY